MRRKALIIANQNYQVKPLRYPVLDAEAIAEILKHKNFDVNVSIDVNSTEFFAALDRFITNIEKTDDIVFYYAGHGIQRDNKNYLIPIETVDEANCTYESPSLDEVLNKIIVATDGIKIIILDACRSNPEDIFSKMVEGRGRDEVVKREKGLAEATCSHNTIIAYSTSPGHTAIDGDSESGNSPYCKALVKYIAKYELRVEQMFSLVREEVIHLTDFKQIPWEHSSLVSPFYFDSLKIPINIYDSINLPFKNVQSICHSPDGNFVALSGDSSKFEIKFLSKPGAVDITFGNEGGQVESVAYSREYLAASTSSGFIGLWGIVNKGVKKRKVHSGNSFKVAISQDSKFLASIGDGNIVKIWQTKGLHRIRKLRSSGNLYSVAFNPRNNDEICVVGDKVKFEVWDIKASVVKFRNIGRRGAGYDVKYSPNGSLIAISYSGGLIEIRNSDNYKLKHKIKLDEYVTNVTTVIDCVKDGQKIPSNDIVSIDFSPCGRIIAAGTSDPSVVFIDSEYGEIIKEIKLDAAIGHIYGLSFNPVNATLMISGGRNQAYVFGYSSPQLINSKRRYSKVRRGVL